MTMSRTPEWKYGMVLQRGQRRVMFVQFDRSRNRMTGGEWFIGMRLDYNDRVPKEFYKIGDMANYTTSGWRLADE
jgi:hypothetical protein